MTGGQNEGSRPIGGALVVCAVLLVGAVPASADPNNNNSAKLRKAVTVEGILEHESAFQEIADAAEGNRLSGAPGYDDSAEYVAGRGCRVRRRGPSSNTYWISWPTSKRLS